VLAMHLLLRKCCLQRPNQPLLPLDGAFAPRVGAAGNRVAAILLAP